MTYKDPRPTPPRHGTHPADPATFEHTDATCPCEPWQLTVNGNTQTMHRPVTGRGDIARKPLIKGGKEKA